MTQAATERLPDAMIIQQVGSAVVLCWHDLPLKVQGQILAQANDMIGIAPIPGIREQIVRLMLRRAPRHNTAMYAGGQNER